MEYPRHFRWTVNDVYVVYQHGNRSLLNEIARMGNRAVNVTATACLLLMDWHRGRLDMSRGELVVQAAARHGYRVIDEGAQGQIFLMNEDGQQMSVDAGGYYRDSYYDEEA